MIHIYADRKANAHVLNVETSGTGEEFLMEVAAAVLGVYRQICDKDKENGRKRGDVFRFLLVSALNKPEFWENERILKVDQTEWELKS